MSSNRIDWQQPLLPLPLHMDTLRLVFSFLTGHELVLLRSVHRSWNELSRSTALYARTAQWRPLTVTELRAVLAVADAATDAGTDALPVSWLWPAAGLRYPLPRQHSAVVAALTDVSLDECDGLDPTDVQQLFALCPRLRALSVDDWAADSLTGALDSALVAHPALALRSLRLGRSVSVTRLLDDYDLDMIGPSRPRMSRLADFASGLERLDGLSIAATDTLALLSELPQLRHIALESVNEETLAVVPRLASVTSLDLSWCWEMQAALTRLCPLLPLRHLSVSWGGYNPDVSVTAPELVACLSPASACHATLECLDFAFNYVPLAAVFDLCATLPALRVLLVSCRQDDSPPEATAASFAAFLRVQGRRLQRLSVPWHPLRSTLPRVLPQVLAACSAELELLGLEPSAPQWDALDLRGLDQSPIRLLKLRLRGPPNESAVLSVAPLGHPMFQRLQRLHVLFAQFSFPADAAADLPRLPELRELRVHVQVLETMTAASLLAWGEIAPRLTLFWCSSVSDPRNLTPALAACFPRLTNLALVFAQITDQARVWQDLGSLPHLRELYIWPMYRESPLLSAELLEQRVAVEGSFPALQRLTLRVDESPWLTFCQRLRERRDRWTVQNRHCDHPLLF